jgi:hypothetical protein
MFWQSGQEEEKRALKSIKKSPWAKEYEHGIKTVSGWPGISTVKQPLPDNANGVSTNGRTHNFKSHN